MNYIQEKQMYNFEINKNGISIKYDYQRGEFLLNSSIQDLSKIVPVSMCWLIEESCNLNCIYCYSSHKSMEDSDMNYRQTIDNILSYNPVSVVLTGGEPTLNKYLIDILQYIDGRIVTIIDSNGTTNVWDSLLPFMKNTVVRISIDSIDPQIIQIVRPAKKMSASLELERISENIDMLVKNEIPIIVQTVLTSHNINCLDDVYSFLVKHKVPRWYISCVKQPTNNYFCVDKLVVSHDSLLDLKEKTRYWNNEGIITTLSQELDDGKASRLFIEKSGKYYVDTIQLGKQYIGVNPNNPTIEEIIDAIDINRHYNLYLGHNNIL